MKKPSLHFLTSRFASQKLRRYKAPFAILFVLMGVCSNLGTRLGLWSTPAKNGLLPYEAPTFKVFREIVISDAFAS